MGNSQTDVSQQALVADLVQVFFKAYRQGHKWQDDQAYLFNLNGASGRSLYGQEHSDTASWGRFSEYAAEDGSNPPEWSLVLKWSITFKQPGVEECQISIRNFHVEGVYWAWSDEQKAWTKNFLAGNTMEPEAFTDFWFALRQELVKYAVEHNLPTGDLMRFMPLGA